MFNSSIKMPKGVHSVQVIQAISTFSYAIIYSSLILYITKQLGYTQTAANNVMGVFLAFNFVLHLLGGVMGGSFISNRSLFFITTLLQTIGIGILATSDASNLFVGLSLFLVGCGINTTCLNNMLTQRFQHDDNRRDTAFFYELCGYECWFLCWFFH